MKTKLFFVLFIVALLGTVAPTALLAQQLPDCDPYEIQAGDTLGGLAVQWETTVLEIREANGLEDSRIRAGDELIRPGCEVALDAEIMIAPPTNVDVTEKLVGTLDDFGGLIDEFGMWERFSLEGNQIRMELNSGDLWVANANAIHNGSFKSQEGCVLPYGQGPGEVFLTGWDGIWFVLSSDSELTLNQGIAAMRETLVRAHGCEEDGIQFVNVMRVNTDETASAFSALTVDGEVADPMSVIRGQTTLALGAGSVYDESFALEGELAIGYTVNGGTDQANGDKIPQCSILVYETPANGGRVRFAAANGVIFEWAPDFVDTESAVEAVTELAESTRECTTWTLYEVARFGRPIN